MSPQPSDDHINALDISSSGDPRASMRPDVGLAGEFIGPYHLLQPLGAGGMGEVWLAEQTQPMRRRVALKLINVRPWP